MMHRQLANLVKKRHSKIEETLKNVVKDFDVKDIHLFRLEVKKLRSFLRLASMTNRKSSHQKLPNKLCEFYSSIGAIRNLQLHQKGIAKLIDQETKPYLDFIHHEINTHIELARMIVKGKRPFLKGSKELIKQLPYELKSSFIRKFTNDKLETLTHLMKPSSLSDESLHSVRKTLKDILYTSSFTTEQTAVPSVVVMSKEGISSITKLLGDFQDKCVGLDLLHLHYKKQSINLNERIVWRQLENRLWNEKEGARENIHRVFQKEFILQLDQAQKEGIKLLAKPINLLIQ